MERFEYIKNDKEIIEIYDNISQNEEREKGGAHHGIRHVLNVVSLVEKLLRDLNYDDEFIEEAKIAAILHDVGCIEGKENHPERSYRFSKEYIERKNINLKYKEDVLEAIKNHSSGFDTNNIITLALILSDKLDVKYTRITSAGRNIVGNRQFLHIQDIKLEIKDDILKVNFITDNNLDLKELEEYYFIEKIFKAIKTFSDKMKFTPEVFLDEKRWDKFYSSI